MPKLTNKQVLDVIKQLQINPEIITVDMLKKGMRVEFEHGLRDARTNITNDDLIMTAKIALAHYQEGLEYYNLLDKLEAKLEKTAKKKGKPHLYM